MQMFNPPHPSESWEVHIELNQILNGKSSVTPIIAIKLAKTFVGTAFSWLNQQACFDLWYAQQEYSAKDLRVIYKPS